jgi:hypothetical protein
LPGNDGVQSDPELLIGPVLKGSKIGETALFDIQGANDTASALCLPLLLWRSREAGINMKAQSLGERTVLGIDLAPWSGPMADSCLQVVDAVDGGTPPRRWKA